MARFIMVVRSHSPNLEIKLEDYDDWYEKRHIPEVLQLPEFISAQRFRVASHVSGEATHEFLTHYEIEAESSEAAKKALIDAAMSGNFYMLPGLDTSKMVTEIYEPMTPLVTKGEF